MLVGRAAGEEEALKSANWGAVLLVQGPLADLYYAADVGAKISPVTVAEVAGNCPQHIVTMAFIGAVADVTQVMAALRNEGAIA
jgi:chemotaxis response regulator CheB